MTNTTSLPHWDLSPIFPSLKSPEFEAAFQRIAPDIQAASELFDRLGVGEAQNVPIDPATISAFELVIDQLNSVTERIETLGAYISGHVAVNSLDTEAQGRYSQFQEDTVKFAQLLPQFTAWVGAMNIDALLEQSAVAREYAFFVRHTAEMAAHLMPAAEEKLAAELTVTGAGAWGKLYSDVWSQLQVPITLDSEQKALPMSAVRNLAFDADASVRKAAYDAELAMWQATSVPLAAAMNSIKGQVNTLSRRRGWNTPLDEAILRNHIDRETLDAMMAAARESFPDFRRYLRAKAKALGTPGPLPWHDLFAPLTAAEREWTWPDTERFIVEQFATYSPRMSEYAARAFREGWIDAEPRANKAGGAFCMWVQNDESRILTNFSPAFNGVSTVAHELGHGYHNLNLARRTVLQRDTPMTLAETASIFCETIIREAAMRSASGPEQLSILEASLQGSCQIVVDIASRLIFEENVFRDRVSRELSVDELNEAMLRAQEETYGDGLDPNLRHPFMWAVKPHYYTTSSFYNFPYLFGMLFGLGLYARYEADPSGFRQSYDDLLSSTGLADAATLANRFGIDIHSEAFWRGSLDIIRVDIKKFEELVGIMG